MKDTNTGVLDYTGNGELKKICFRYPSNAKWSCVRCGDCCKDVTNHVRRILLTCKDLEIITTATGLENFYELTGEEPFEAVMKKKDGVCIFLRDERCTIYESRALLCRMYPFWVERNGEEFIIKMDKGCHGAGDGETLDEDFFSDILKYALHSIGY